MEWNGVVHDVMKRDLLSGMDPFLLLEFFRFKNLKYEMEWDEYRMECTNNIY